MPQVEASAKTGCNSTLAPCLSTTLLAAECGCKVAIMLCHPNIYCDFHNRSRSFRYGGDLQVKLPCDNIWTNSEGGRAGITASHIRHTKTRCRDDILVVQHRW
jgi:hypothetical protein